MVSERCGAEHGVPMNACMYVCVRDNPHQRTKLFVIAPCFGTQLLPLTRSSTKTEHTVVNSTPISHFLQDRISRFVVLRRSLFVHYPWAPYKVHRDQT